MMRFERRKKEVPAFDFSNGIDLETASKDAIRAYLEYQEGRKPGQQMDPETMKDIDSAISEARSALERRFNS